MSELIKTLKENIAAIITAAIVFLLVSFYLLRIVPTNKKNIDNYYKSTMEEFSHQFNGTLKDYANQVDLENFKDSIIRKAGILCKQYEMQDHSDTMITILNDLQNPNGHILGHIRNNIIIGHVLIDSVKDKGHEIILYKRINFKFGEAIAAEYDIAAHHKIADKLCCIPDTTRIQKSLLKKRLGGAIIFEDWMIYTADSKIPFLSNNIDPAEFDSLKSKSFESGVLTIKSSDKRFYRQSVSIDETNFNVILIGAVSQAYFDAKSQKVNLNTIFISILLVILLFLCIPLIKPLISSKKEKLTQLDLLNTSSCIGILAIVLISFCFSNYLSSCYKNMGCIQLTNQNKKISASISAEFSKYYSVFNSIDTTLQSPVKNGIHVDLDKLDIGKNNTTDKKNMDTLIRKNLQNYFTFNGEGDLVKDISTDSTFFIRKNFSERNYFQVLKGLPVKSVFTAVFSKYDNKYKLVYVAKDSPDSSLVSGFAFIPDFTRHIKTNQYSGYILCDKTGRVILSSDTTKSLNENIYLNSQRNYELSKMFHGLNDTSFELNYNGDPCLFFAKRFIPDINFIDKKNKAKKITLSDYPVYLLTYKNLDFNNKLKIYTLVNGFILSLAYACGAMLLVLLYSVFFYLGDIPILSRLHVYWLFPDNSRTKEYKLLRIINYSLFTVFLILFMFGSEHTLYCALLTGINLGFFNFVLLNQRVFSFIKKADGTYGKRDFWMALLIIFAIVPGYVFPLAFYYFHLPTTGLSISLLGHLAFLFMLKKDTEKDAIPLNQEISEESNRPYFISFFSSIISYHFLLIPILIISALFLNEMNTVKDLNNSKSPQEEYSDNSGSSPYSHYILNTNGKVISALPVPPPSRKFLEDVDFDSFRHFQYDFKFRNFVFFKENFHPTIMLLACLIFIMLLILRLTNFYSGRFFFFELSEAYRLQYFHVKNQFTNYKAILPPFAESDLESLEMHEKFQADAEKEQKEKEETGKELPNVWLKGIPGKIVSNEVKMDLIMMNNFKRYKIAYQEAWNLLNPEEKFVMSDFAMDHFVNYKNRDVLMELMAKGYIIADGLTGRLRVMNYGFRNYIVNLETNDPKSAKALKEAETQIKGTYSKWKLPLIIIAVTGLLLLMTIYQDSYNHILILGSSVISAIGLIAKFLDNYKK